MHPVLLELGPLRVPSYGAMLAIGFLAALGLIVRLAPAAGLEPRRVVEAACWLVLGGGVGSRLLFVLEDPASLGSAPLEVFALWRGGAVWYGGVLGGIAALLLCRRALGLPLWRLGDVTAPGLALAHVFGRLGCFLAGCCWGRPSDLPWAVVFPEHGLCRLPGQPLHPTQLYEAAGEAGICVLLLALFRNRRFAGQVFLSYFVLYPTLRFTVEMFRADVERGFVFGGMLSFAQAASLIALASAAALLWIRGAATPPRDRDGERIGEGAADHLARGVRSFDHASPGGQR